MSLFRELRHLSDTTNNKLAKAEADRLYPKMVKYLREEAAKGAVCIEFKNNGFEELYSNKTNSTYYDIMIKDLKKRFKREKLKLRYVYMMVGNGYFVISLGR